MPKIKLNTDINEESPLPIVSYHRELAKGEHIPFHQHQRTQLVYANRGLMNVTTRSACYVIPPQRAVLMPAKVEHRIDTIRALSMQSLYIRPSLISEFSAEPCVLQIAPMLRELIVYAVSLGNDYQVDSPQGRVMQVILDQILSQQVLSLSLPLPQDHRLLRITQALMSNLADTRTLDDWAQYVGASKRTINRLFSAQTGMPFQSWRQQLKLQRSLELLAVGDSVTQVALELGYESSSSFIAMFKRCFGVTPTQYLKTTYRGTLESER